MLVHKAVNPSVLWQRQCQLLIYSHLRFLSARHPFLSLLLVILLYTIHCPVKLSGTLLSILKTTAGCLAGREDKHWQGTSIVLYSHNNQGLIWLSHSLSLSCSGSTLPRCQTSLSPLISHSLPCRYLFPDRGQREFLCQRGTVWELEDKVKEAW